MCKKRIASLHFASDNTLVYEVITDNGALYLRIKLIGLKFTILSLEGHFLVIQ